MEDLSIDVMLLKQILEKDHCFVYVSGELRIGGFGVSVSSIKVNEFLYHLSA